MLYLHVDRSDLIEKFVAEKTGKNYDSAMRIRKNISQWKSPRGVDTEGTYICEYFHFQKNILFIY